MTLSFTRVESEGNCPLCGGFLEFNCTTPDGQFNIEKCDTCGATAVMDSFTVPTQSGFRERSGDVECDIDTMFDYILESDISKEEVFKILSHPEVALSLTYKLEEVRRTTVLQ